MKRLVKVLGVLAVQAMVLVSTVSAQDLSASAGADVVSSYVWRGAYQGMGAAIQPGASLSYGGLSVGVWGSTPMGDFAGGKEMDYYVSYGIGNFSATVTDYWWSGEGATYFTGPGHYYEAAIAYTISESFPLSLSVSTMFSALGDLDVDGKANYSTYVYASYPFAIESVDCEVGIGYTPWNGMYSTESKSDIASISAKFSKDIKITDDFALPLFSEAIFSPAMDDSYIVFGLSLNL